MVFDLNTWHKNICPIWSVGFNEKAVFLFAIRRDKNLHNSISAGSFMLYENMQIRFTIEKKCLGFFLQIFPIFRLCACLPYLNDPKIQPHHVYVCLPHFSSNFAQKIKSRQNLFTCSISFSINHQS